MRKILYCLIFIVLCGIIFYILQSPYVSRVLSAQIIPELEAISGKKVSVDKIVLHLFPLSVEGKGIRVSDYNGRNFLTIEKAKAYVRAAELVYRKLSINRLAIHNPDITTDNKELDEIIKHVETYLQQEKEQSLEVKVKVIEVINGNIRFSDSTFQGVLVLRDLKGEFISGRKRELNASARELSIEKEGWPDLTCDINTHIQFTKEGINIKRLQAGAFGSVLESRGYYSKGEGNLKTKVALIVNSVKRMFKLGRSGSGKIQVNGGIKLRQQPSGKSSINLNSVLLDIELGGEFHIQTLMELLKVEERIEGLVDFSGRISGPLSDISGNAKANLENGNLYGVDIDSLDCTITYRDGLMTFDDGAANLYSGTAQANAQIALPVVTSYVLNIKAQSIDSRAILGLIGWEPDIPVGTVDGELSTSGSSFNPSGKFAYTAHEPLSENVVGRIKNMSGTYELKNGVLAFSDAQMNTAQTNVTVHGTVDITREILGLKAKLYTNDITDLTLPYYENATGRGTLHGEIIGTFDNPVFSMKADLSEVTIEGYKAASTAADFSYSKHLLNMKKSVFTSAGEEHRMEGKIRFPDAEELFEFPSPEYNLTASVTNADFAHALQIFYKDVPVQGTLDASFSMQGKGVGYEISGRATIREASVYDIPLDSSTADFIYRENEFVLNSIKIIKGRSVIHAEGMLTSPDRFFYRMSSEKFFLKDMDLPYMPDDAIVSLTSKGEGTLDDPIISVNAKVLGGTFEGRDMGTGIIQSTIRNKNISVDAALFNEKVTLKGRGQLDDNIPWKADLQIQPARYDFIVSSILKDVPEDLHLTLEGEIHMHGDRNSLNASAGIKHLSLSLLEQTFTNDSEIRILLQNKSVSFPTFVLRSGATSFELKGGMDVGENYDLHLKGSSALVPFKGFSKKIGYLKGNADFVLSVTGTWDDPEIKGHMNVTDTSFGLRDYPAYISAINGYLYIDEDSVVLENLSGKIGGGNVLISGHLDLEAFSMKRFYIETELEDITAVISKDFNINFKGELVYKGTGDAQSLTGDIFVKRAKYREMVEWRSWLLKAKSKDIPKLEEPILENTQLNIRISGSDNIAIDNNIARTPVRVRGDMIVKGTLTNPILFGRVESNEGYVYFRNNEFRIIYLSADFADPHRIKPVINLSAETIVQGYDIRLNLEGQLDRFTLALSSDPYLEEVDILSLLTVGQVGKQLKGLEGGVGAGQATSFLTGKAQDVIEERLRTLTGLDRFQVEPYVSKTTSTVEPRVTVSERLIGDSLFVTYTSSLGSTEEEIVKLEYLLGKHISLIGVRDERGGIGGDVQFRFSFK